MRITLVSSASAAALLLASGAQAQAQTDQTDAAIPTVVVTDESRASTAYSYGDPINSGETTFGADSIRDRAPGSGDGNQILKLAPTVQFSNDEGMGTREGVQDIRPAQISIAGASPLDNQFILDGVSVNSRLYDAGNLLGIDEVAGGSPQGTWVDSNLIGKITLLDSNVSAEYGGFLGGVVDVETRAPASTYGVTAYYGLTRTDMASFRMPDSVRRELGDNVPESPDYEKSRYGFTVDLPITDRLRLLAAYSYSDSEVTYYRNANYLERNFGQSSKAENFLLKAEYDLSSDLTFDGQINWSPYESTNASPAAINALMTQKGGGLTTKGRLRGRRGDADWSVQLSYADLDSGREAPDVQYTLPGRAEEIDWCTSTNCTTGGLGDIDQNQKDYGLKADWRQSLGFGEMGLGLDFAQTEVMKHRPQTNHVWQTGIVSPDIVCAAPNEDPLTCVTGSYVITRHQEYQAYRNETSVQTYGLWSEYAFDWSGFQVRAGLRYDYESYLKNHNVAPRLSIARALPWWGMTATIGANRYYRQSFLGYAVRENSLQTLQYEREEVDGVWGDTWYLTGDNSAPRFSEYGLATPYSDELTAAIQGDLLGGRYRIKGILRDGKDQFSTTEIRENYVNELGQTRSRLVATPNNDGHSNYRGLSLEWNRDFGRHTLALNTNFSRAQSTNLTFFEESEDLEGAELVYYNGRVVSLFEALSDNQRADFASPIVINADWGSSWLNGRVMTNINARFRDEFTRVEDTGETMTVDGSAYDVYGPITYDASIDANLSVQAEIARTQFGTATLDLRVNNLFDTIRNNNSTATSQPYQLGRNIWVSLKYQY
ncbi:TonB-dependent receptor plug domain-containing protein [Brevundimonas sp.]|jgi:hypothetical protein|uniref:TonB-dependent receptor plug domain-containing protein n=1 Tax=Brevundimonas sp. TaxID=1871086 RepID=UPI0037BEF8EC